MLDIKTFENSSLNCTVNLIIVDGCYWFKGKDIATALGYHDTTYALREHVDEEDKTKMEKLRAEKNSGLGSSKNSFNEKNTIYINESGLYSLVLHSKKPEAKCFKKWVTSEVLPAIRQTGEYKLPENRNRTPELHLENETDLHYKVIDYIRKYFPHARLGAGLGEQQNTSERRLDAWRKGYQRGAPDIIIYNKHVKYNGFAIELKSPTGRGKLSTDQSQFLLDLQHSGFKTMVSNNYDDILHEIEDYLRNIRYVCDVCKNRRLFSSLTKLKEHSKQYHDQDDENS